MSRVPPSFSLFPYTTLFRSIDGVFAAAVDFGVTFLTAKAFHFGHGHAFNTELGQGFLDLLELERFDDRFQFFHVELIALDRKSTRLNSSHTVTSYAVYCLKK